MKVAYIIPYGLYYDNKGTECKRPISGVEKKYISQEKALIENGVEANLLILNISTKSPIDYLNSSYLAYKSIKRAAKEVDVLYCRSFIPYISYLLVILSKPMSKIVFEVQSIIPKSTKIYLKHRVVDNIRALYILLSEFFIGTVITKRSDGIVSVTKETTTFYYQRSKQKTRCITIGNGIDLSLYTSRTIPCETQVIHVLIVASVHPSHGIDRFIHGIQKYESQNNPTPIILHIVGDGPELPNLKKMVAELNMDEKIIFHGFKSGKELDEMFDMCHIALDVLAGFRKGLTETSSLKSREYCARGIPFIASSKDADFPDGWEYVQKIPDDETPVDMNTVVNFANRMMADPEHPQKMRRYAEEHLDWMAKMKVLKEFLESL